MYYFYGAEENELPVTGTITIPDVRFPPKEDFKTNTEYSQWFVCFFVCDAAVVASEVVQPNNDGSLTFNGPFEIEGLPEHFQIHFILYSMNLRTNRHPSTKVRFKHHPIKT